MLTDLAEFTHFVTRVKIVPAVADDPALIEVERARGRGFAEKLSMRVLSRTWQMLLKGHCRGDRRRPSAGGCRNGAGAHRLCRRSADPRRGDPLPVGGFESGDAAAQSRPGNSGGATVGALASAAPRLAAQRQGDGAARRSDAVRRCAAHRKPLWRRYPLATPSHVCADAEPSAPALVVGRFEDLIALAAQKRDLGVKLALERDVRLVRCEDGRLEIRLEQSAAKTLVNDLARKIFAMDQSALDGRGVGGSRAQPTVKSQNDARQAELKIGVRADPLVQAVLARFPGAEIVDVRRGEMPQALPPGDPDSGDLDDGAPELPAEDDGSAFGAHGHPDEGEP